MEYVRYKHSRFTARFPSEFRYAPSHYWMALINEEERIWHVGFTKFATRMLGELVEAEFKVPVGGQVQLGQEIGWVEGFKAASDVFCVVDGDFGGINPALVEDACIIRSSPYQDGYLYSVQGEPGEGDLDVHQYIKHLDGLINLMQLDPKYAEDENAEAAP